MHCLSEDIDGLIQRFSPFTRPGSSILVAQKGEILFCKGYGMADIEAGLPANADTTYLIASVTKQFACAAAMLLAEQGKLDIDGPVDAWLPIFPSFGKKVTIRHLMTHTSGIPEYFTRQFQDIYCRDNSPDLDLSGLLALIADRYRDLAFAPGSRWEYCNTGYVILGEIIRRAADMPFEDYLHQKIFAPLGMDHTRVGTGPPRPGGMAKGYRKNEQGQLVPCPYTKVVVGWADGNVISNAPDMFTWLQQIRRGGLLSAASWQQILTPYTLGSGKPARYGLGWFFDDRLRLNERWHTGSTTGFHCRVSWFDALETDVVWLCNLDADNAGDLNIPFGHLITRLLGNHMPPMPRWHALSPSGAARWVGTWINGGSGDQSTEDDDEQLRFKITRQNDGRLTLDGELKGSWGKWPLIPASDHTCWIDSGAHYFLEMETKEKGPPVLYLHLYGRTLAFKRHPGKARRKFFK